MQWILFSFSQVGKLCGRENHGLRPWQRGQTQQPRGNNVCALSARPEPLRGALWRPNSESWPRITWASVHLVLHTPALTLRSATASAQAVQPQE